MSETKKLAVSFELDTTELEEQVQEIQSLLKNLLEGLPGDLNCPLLSNLLTLFNDIILTDNSPAGGTGFNIIHSVRFGAEYERFTAAIRAGKLELNSL